MKGGTGTVSETQAVINRTLDKRRQDLRERRREQRARREAVRIERFVADQGLSAQQGEQLRGIMAALREARVASRLAVKAGEKTREEARAELRDGRKAANAELAELLDEAQLEAWRAVQRGARTGAFGGRPSPVDNAGGRGRGAP